MGDHLNPKVVSVQLAEEFDPKSDMIDYRMSKNPSPEWQYVRYVVCCCL